MPLKMVYGEPKLDMAGLHNEHINQAISTRSSVGKQDHLDYSHDKKTNRAQVSNENREELDRLMTKKRKRRKKGLARETTKQVGKNRKRQGNQERATRLYKRQKYTREAHRKVRTGEKK